MNIRVASPCKADWVKMAGDERMRYCTLCSLNVYNFAEMTADEIRALLLRTEGRVCVRLYRRADGTLLTRDCPTALQALRQRVSRFSTAVIAAVFSLSAFASSGTTCEKPGIKKHGAKVDFSIERVVDPQRATFTGVVADDSGNPLPGVTISLQDESTQRAVQTVTDANGTFTIALDDATYRVLMTLPGCKPAVMEHLPLQQNEVTRACVTMHLEPLVTVTIGAVAIDPRWIANEPLSTTFSHDFVAKLPISGQR